MGHRNARNFVRHKPVIAQLVEESDHLRHRPPSGQPGQAILLAGQVGRPFDEDGPRLAGQAPHGASPAHPRELLLDRSGSEGGLGCGPYTGRQWQR